MNQPKNNGGRSLPSRSPASAGKTRIGSAISAKRKSADETRISSNISVRKNAPAKQKPSSGANSGKKRLGGINLKKDEVQSIFKQTATRALIYILVVVVISTVLSIIGIKWANDLFALVKEDKPTVITIPENATVSEISNILGDNGIIKYPFVFRTYVGYKYRDVNDGAGLIFKPGEHEVNSTLNYDQLVSELRFRTTREVIKITIPEGYTIDEIIELFISKGMGTKEGFVDAINNFEYEYDFITKLNEIGLSKDRKYRLEGYLFPDTYEFYTDSSEIVIVDKMLANFQSKFEIAYYDRIKELKLNLDQLITLASMIQKEVKSSAEFYTVSGVFHNRINAGMRFESDATLQYILDERKESISYEDTQINNPYNSYITKGFVPSAICNPGLDAISAALYPEKNDYYYFVVNVDGSTLFASNYQQHIKNQAIIEAAKKAAKAN